MSKSSRDRRKKASSLKKILGRPRWREHHARVVIGAWADSGLNARQYAERHEVSQKRLERWSSRLRKLDAAPAEPPRFVPVALSATATSFPTSNASKDAVDAMELVLPTGIRVTVGTGFDPGALRRLLETIGC